MIARLDLKVVYGIVDSFPGVGWRNIDTQIFVAEAWSKRKNADL